MLFILLKKKKHLSSPKTAGWRPKAPYPPRLDPSLGCSGPFKAYARSEVGERCPPEKLETPQGGGPELCAPLAVSSGFGPETRLAGCACPFLSTLASHLRCPCDVPDWDPLARPDAAHRIGVDVRAHPEPLAAGVSSPTRGPPAAAEPAQRELGARFGARWAPAQGPGWDGREARGQQSQPESRCFSV